MFFSLFLWVWWCWFCIPNSDVFQIPLDQFCLSFDFFIRCCLRASRNVVVWVLSGCCGLFWGGFWSCFWCFGDAEFASSNVMYLSFYWTISAHLLTVLYRMMLRRIQEYGSLGVIRVLWMVLERFLNLFLLVWWCWFCIPKSDASQLLLGCFCPSFDWFSSQDAYAHQEIW